MTEIDTNADILDSRDIIARIDELTSDRDDLQETIDDLQETIDEAREERDDALSDGDAPTEESNQLDSALAGAILALENWRDDEGGELAMLEAFANETEGYCPGWSSGATLINTSYFTEYAEQLAGDIGAVNSDASWPLDHIDWEAAAEALKIDYGEADLDGTTFYFRG